MRRRTRRTPCGAESATSRARPRAGPRAQGEARTLRPPARRRSLARRSACAEKVAERPCGLFLEDPSSRMRPEGGHFAAGEPGAHASERVVPRHVVAAERPEHPAAGEREARAARLAGDEKPRALSNRGEQPGKTFVVEVVQEQVDEDRVERLA